MTHGQRKSVGIVLLSAFVALLNFRAETQGSATINTKASLKETPSEKADALLSGLIKTNDPGLAVLVAQNGKILFEKGYGLADVEHHVPITPQTIFRIASITKQFTASAILKLQEERKLSVNDKLSKYIPDFPRGNEVTLRRLLTHTSGIHNYTDEPDFLSRVTNATTTGTIIEEIKKYPYDFDPGAKWNYDNSGYMLLSYIVEKVSGQSYGDFLRENFFQPLGMSNTCIYRANSGLPREALGYSLGTNGFTRALYWDPSWCGGAGALSSTVEDLYRWNEGIFNGRVLHAASLKAAFTPVKQSEGQVNWDASYGFGWFVGHYRGLREISHAGLMSGFRTYLVWLPDGKFTAAILVNTSPGRPNIDPMFLARQLATIFLADKLTPLPTINTKVSPESYDALTGRYDLWGSIITFNRRGTHLFEQFPSGLEREIFPKSDTGFFVKGQDIQFTFVKDSSGNAAKLVFHNYGMDLEASRIKDSAMAEKAEATPATAEARPAIMEKADALLSGLIKTNDPGLAVLVAQNGKILFEKGYGLADREHHVPITLQTTFRIGSITKQFTASAILKLQEEGKLSVDDKLSKYIPDFPRGGEVTLRHLLTHTSGIHSYTEKPDFLSRVTNATTAAAIIEEMKKDPYDFDPGEKWYYDNSGYLLLGYIVEKVSGQSYGDFLRENFFQPLGMTNTGVYRAHRGLPHEALGYDLGTSGFRLALNWDMSWTGGAGVLYSTVEDLFRWNEGIFNGRVLDEASLKAAFTPGKTKENQAYYSPENGYGFGWFTGRHRGLREIMHNGGLQGFRSSLWRFPDEKLTVVVLANAYPGRTDADPYLIAPQLVYYVLGDKLAPLPVVNTNISPKFYDALIGRYSLLGSIMTISRRGTQLFEKYASQPENEIFPQSDTEFFLKVTDDVQITFVKDSSGKVVKLMLRQNGLDLEGLRTNDFVEAKVDPAVYNGLLGKYDYGQGHVLTVTREGDHLFAQLTGQEKCEIYPRSDAEYFWKDVNARVTFVRDSRGKVIKAIHHQGSQTFDAPKIQ